MCVCVYNIIAGIKIRNVEKKSKCKITFLF